MSAIVDTYMAWMLELGDDTFIETYVPPQAISQGAYKIKVLDMFREFLSLLHDRHTDSSRKL